MTEQPRKTLVIAPTYAHYTHWCRERGINPRGREAQYISRAESLHGQRNVDIVHLGAPMGWGFEDLMRAEVALDVIRQTDTQPKESHV